MGPLAAACASEGIRRDTGIVSWLYWPNLVTIDDRVVAKAGLSLAPAPGLEGKTRVTMDISVNCFSKGSSALPSIDMPTTSILEALGVEIDVDLLRDKILHALNWYYAEWERGMHRKLADRIQPTIAWLGRSVEVRTRGGSSVKGMSKGLGDLGSLLLEQDRGKKPRTLAVRPDAVEFVLVEG